MSKPVHLNRFPCMEPWVGENYRHHRIMVLAESHYMPPDATINLDADTWYSATQADLSDCELSFIYTKGCVEYRLSEEGLRKILPHYNVYWQINEVIPFDRIVFANYFYRPAVYKRGIKSVGITSRDISVADQILLWIVRVYAPQFVIVASGAWAGPPASKLLGELDVQHCCAHHPLSTGTEVPPLPSCRMPSARTCAPRPGGGSPL